MKKQKRQKMNIEKWNNFINDLKKWRKSLMNMRGKMNNWINATEIEKNHYQIIQLRRMTTSNIEEIDYQLSLLIED